MLPANIRMFIRRIVPAILCIIKNTCTLGHRKVKWTLGCAISYIPGVWKYASKGSLFSSILERVSVNVSYYWGFTNTFGEYDYSTFQKLWPGELS